MEVAEANAANSRAGTWKENAEPQLVFCRAMTQKMLTNNLDNSEMAVTQTGHPRIWGSLKRVHMDHKLAKRPLSTGAWDKSIGTWAIARDVY